MVGARVDCTAFCTSVSEPFSNTHAHCPLSRHIFTQGMPKRLVYHVIACSSLHIYSSYTFAFMYGGEFERKRLIAMEEYESAAVLSHSLRIITRAFTKRRNIIINS